MLRSIADSELQAYTRGYSGVEDFEVLLVGGVGLDDTSSNSYSRASPSQVVGLKIAKGAGLPKLFFTPPPTSTLFLNKKLFAYKLKPELK